MQKFQYVNEFLFNEINMKTFPKTRNTHIFWHKTALLADFISATGWQSLKYMFLIFLLKNNNI